MMDQPTRIVVAMTGASGAAYGEKTLRLLRSTPGIETHLVISHGARSTITAELGMHVADVLDLADVVHADNDLGASIASGSFRTAGMIVAPCSIKTLSAVATSNAENLVARAADVTLKERRPLVLMVRETPLHRGHLRLMCDATDAGAIIAPPVPSFYTLPESVDAIVEQTCRRALELLGVVLDDTTRWTGRPVRRSTAGVS